MIVVIDIHATKVLFQSNSKDKLHEVVFLILTSIEVKIVRVDVLHDICYRFDWYLDERLLRLTYEVHLPSVDSNSLLHNTNVTIINLTFIIIRRLVKER